MLRGWRWHPRREPQRRRRRMDFSVCLVAGGGTLCHGLVDSLVICQMFDSISLEAFSDLNDSVILCS